MKKLIVLSLLSLSVGIAVIMPKSGMCYGDCKPGKKCISDFNCNSTMCNLSCQAIDKVGLDKRCVLN